ncbi:hypothetical protein [Streptomyces sp. CMB-StM0423]|uniref:hypothetical protein n=1 Tax=Streptomyces sp. CMB-StM0423 TaxID=2059884 RepID=UPI000C70E628|nr:hypothetical protein [Streptomyces sp. CMB-StM0423]AUH40472.1 hypothetical protein CXR04_09575 [Streptomyces sp. CMB-StM0423]
MAVARPPVPYVARWTGEDRLSEPLVIHNFRRIAYAYEHDLDRDSMGVLWARRPLRRGVGRPQLGHIHPQRQRRAMLRLLCQVCAVPAHEDESGVLWLLEDHSEVPGWPENEVTVHPPVCAPCAEKSPVWCRHLREGGAALVRVRHPDIDGVYGLSYRPDGEHAVPAGEVTVAYDDPAAAWVLASQMTRALRGCTVIELIPGRRRH